MDESKVFEGAAVLEQLANTHIVPKHFSTHLCASTRDQHFRAMFLEHRLGLPSYCGLSWTMIGMDQMEEYVYICYGCCCF